MNVWTEVLKHRENKDENVHRFALSAIRGELLEREREKEIDSFGILYTDYLLSIVKIKRERKRKKREAKNVWPKVNRLISIDLLNANLKMQGYKVNIINLILS